MADILPKATPADAKAVWEAMLAGGEKPSSQKVADRLGAKFAKPSKNTVNLWRQNDWIVKDGHGKQRSPNEEAQANLGTAVAVAAGDPTLNLKQFMDSAEVQALIPDVQAKSLPELVRLAAEEQFKTLIAMARWTRKMAAEGTTKVVEEEGAEGQAPTSKVVHETPSIPHVSGLVSALAGSFSTSTSVADKANTLGMKDVTPSNEDGKIIEGEVLSPQDELAEVMAKVAAAGNAVPTD